MEQREEGGRAEAEPLRGRDKILCYINMQSPGEGGGQVVKPSSDDAVSAFKGSFWSF